MSRTRALRLALATGLTAVALGIGAGVGSAGASAPAEESPAVSVGMTGVFGFHACPAGTPAADACLTDHVTGVLPGLGAVSGVFEVHIAFSQAAVDQCQPIDKHGSFTTAAGHRLTLRAAGQYCGKEGIASYDYRVVGGGHGHGQWLVPPPASFAAGNGSGPEYFFGTLAR